MSLTSKKIDVIDNVIILPCNLFHLKVESLFEKIKNHDAERITKLLKNPSENDKKLPYLIYEILKYPKLMDNNALTNAFAEVYLPIFFKFDLSVISNQENKRIWEEINH